MIAIWARAALAALFRAIVVCAIVAVALGLVGLGVMIFHRRIDIISSAELGNMRGFFFALKDVPVGGLAEKKQLSPIGGLALFDIKITRPQVARTEFERASWGESPSITGRLPVTLKSKAVAIPIRAMHAVGAYYEVDRIGSTSVFPCNRGGGCFGARGKFGTNWNGNLRNANVGSLAIFHGLFQSIVSYQENASTQDSPYEQQRGPNYEPKRKTSYRFALPKPPPSCWYFFLGVVLLCFLVSFVLATCDQPVSPLRNKASLALFLAGIIFDVVAIPIVILSN